jgi:hypothetical protein
MDCKPLAHLCFSQRPLILEERPPICQIFQSSTSRFRDVVEKNIEQSGLDVDQFVLIEGKVEDTLLAWQGESLCYLRLDTDYYDSTKIELDKLYPCLTRGGVLIVDDYGHFSGVRSAVDDYFRAQRLKPLLQCIDYTGRCGVKI